MIDPVSLVVGALVEGLLAGLRGAVEDAVRGSYEALRTLLVQRYGEPVESSLDILEHDPMSAPAQDAVAVALRRAGAERDAQIADLAQQLIDLIRTGRIGPVEQVRQRSGLQALGQVLGEHIDTVLGIRSNYPVEDSELLSTRIAAQRGVPQALTGSVAMLHDRMASIIARIAAVVESAKYADAEVAVQQLDGAYLERQRASRLLDADKRMHISYESLRLTLQYFADLNQWVLSEIETEGGSTGRQGDMMFGNAVMIYELADFVIRYLEGFALSGLSDLEELHGEATRRVAALRSDQEALAQSVHASRSRPGSLDHVLETIEQREEAITAFEQEWARYVSDTRQWVGSIEQVRDTLEELCIYRESARIQIEMLQLVAMLRVLRQNSAAISGSIETLRSFRLAPLDASRVRRLLGPI